MKPRIIKTNEDYQAARERIEQLMAGDPTPDCDEGQELELLAHLIEQYENKEQPMGMPTPVAAIKFRMDQMGLKQRDLARYFGSASRVSEVLRGKRPLTLGMIRAVHAGLGISEKVLLQQPDKPLQAAATQGNWDQFPLTAMLKRGWLNYDGSLQQAKQQARQLITSWISGFASLDMAMAPVRLRQSISKGAHADEYALQVWKLRVIQRALEQPARAAYVKGCVSRDFMRRLVQLSYLDEGPRQASDFLKKHGIRLVTELHLPGTHLDGAALVLADGTPVVALTLRYDRLDNFWFTLCHELAHIALHYERAKESGYLDDLEAHANDEERAADAFATEALVPTRAWALAALLPAPTVANVCALAQQLQITPAIVAGRVRHELNNHKILWQLLGRNTVRKLFAAEVR